MKEKRTDYRSLGYCKYCNEEVFGTHHNKLQYHERFCLCNPDRQKAVDARKRGSINRAKVVSQKQHQQALKNEATRKFRKLICIKCGKEYQLNLTDSEYQKILDNPHAHPFRKHCSQACANSRVISKLQREKQSKTLKKICEHKKRKEYICKNCDKTYTSIESNFRKFCSEQCKLEFSKKPKCISEETRKKLSEAGKRAAARIKFLRRSKNEILFCQLCEQRFQHVENNKPIFNGWDADVLIFDYKVAVMWNGKWHYVQVMEHQKSSLKNIQNRDKIKMKEIDKAGWISYIIKDMGKYKPEFVKQQFDLFCKWITENFQIAGQTGETSARPIETQFIENTSNRDSSSILVVSSKPS